MIECPDEAHIEDLALGLPIPEGTAAHLASCDSCTGIHWAIASERALFELREALVPTPPALVSPPAIERAARWPHALVALACAASIAGIGLHAPKAPDPKAEIPDTSDHAEEPLACLFPASGRVHVSSEALACMTKDRATCEERVTSSLATP